MASDVKRGDKMEWRDAVGCWRSGMVRYVTSDGMSVGIVEWWSGRLHIVPLSQLQAARKDKGEPV